MRVSFGCLPDTPAGVSVGAPGPDARPRATTAGQRAFVARTHGRDGGAPMEDMRTDVVYVEPWDDRELRDQCVAVALSLPREHFLEAQPPRASGVYIHLLDV